MDFINWVDIVLLLILLAFAVFGFISGFTEKFFSLISWTGAAITTMHVYPWLKPWAQKHIDNETLASIVTFAGIFLVLLISFRLATSFISKSIKDSPLGGLDRSLGVVFGIITGLFLLSSLCLADGLYLHTFEKKEAFNESKVWSFTTLTSSYLEKLLPESFAADHLKKKDDREAIVHHLSIPPEVKKRTKGYKEGDRSKLETLSKSA
jgi:membrane protein required for colicin V production